MMSEQEMQLLVELHKDNERQGPGGEAETRKAFQLTGIDPNAPVKIADIGCGTGSQTITLARHTNAHITAVDIFPVFLEQLEQKVVQSGFSERINIVNASMDKLPFSEQEFDLIWSEGAIYIMGFEKGLRYWHKFLKPGGVIGVSEISWITDERPEELEQYWKAAYPEIDTIKNKLQVLEQSGYQALAHFVLPEHCWLENYYYPLEKRFSALMQKYAGDEAAINFLEQERQEIAHYKKYKSYYSYVFYIAKKH